MIRIDRLVDRFVAAVNNSYREPAHIEIEEVPPSVRVGELYEDGWSDWAIKPYPGVLWIEPLEQQLSRTFPAVFRSLVARYIFPSFEAGPVFFFANTPEGTEFREFRNRLFSEDLCGALHRAGFLQIGQPAEGSYDPICFKPYQREAVDSPLVRLEHEAIIERDTIEIVEEIAPSLRYVMNGAIEAAGLQPLME